MDGLRRLHRLAPFLFLNGNTFSEGARELVVDYRAELMQTRADILSVVGHHVAGKSIITLEKLENLLNE